MQQMYSLITPYRCKICGNDMLFFTTKTDKVIDYKSFVSRANTLAETKQFLENRDVKLFKCICCDKLFIIDWTKGWPEQLIDRNVLRQFGV